MSDNTDYPEAENIGKSEMEIALEQIIKMIDGWIENPPKEFLDKITPFIEHAYNLGKKETAEKIFERLEQSPVIQATFKTQLEKLREEFNVK